MKLIEKQGIKTTRHKSEGSFSDVCFEISTIESYIETRKFIVDVKGNTSSRILCLVSGPSDFYQSYLTKKVFDKRMNKVLKIMKNASFFRLEKKKLAGGYIFMINREDLLKNELVLFEMCLLFRFSSLIGLKSSTTPDQVLNNLEKISLWGVFNIKRWKSIAEWQLFFDGEHLAGNFYQKE